jgi:NSS family neurotransmitter:Na+ symporter
MARERWQSRTTFIMAAVGSAIGLGNVWRFPGTCFNNGGGAFFIPYFIALLTAGIPLMIVEYGIGSRFQGSAAKSYKGLGKRYEWIGWWAVLVGLGISFYYCVILAWSWEYCWECAKGVFTGELPWAKGQAGAYFSDDVLQRTGGPTEAGGFVWSAAAGLAATWIVVYLCIAKGVLRVGKVVMITVPLPLVLLLLLAIRGLTLDGAMDGLAYYLSPNWDKLTDPDTWVAAYGQVFFSLSVGWGILIAYASYRPKDSDVVNNAYITSFANCGFSFLAGFAVFSTLGYLGVAMNTPVADLETTSFGLAFTSYPTAIENFKMGGSLQALLGLGFFVMLLTLGVDSAFSIVEAVSTAMYDKFRVKREKLVMLLCIGGFLMGLVFCFGAGIYWLDISDKFLTDLNERSELKVGRFWEICVRFVTPAVLIVILGLAFLNLIQNGYEGYETMALVFAGIVPAAVVFLASFILQSMKGAGDVADDDE